MKKLGKLKVVHWVDSSIQNAGDDTIAEQIGIELVTLLNSVQTYEG